MNVILSVDSVRYPLTGIGRYTFELANQLALHEAVDNLKFMSGTQFSDSLIMPSNETGRSYGIKRMLQKSYIATEAFRLIMPALKARALKGLDDYLYHGPNFYLPPFAGKKVATFHDLSPFTWSHCFPAERLRYMQKEMEKTLLTADALVTDSEFTRRELSEYFSWPLDKIFTVPLACSDDFRPRGTEELAVPLSKYNLQPGGYALYVGTIEPRKNIDALLDAYSRLPVAERKRWPLVLAGYKGWRSDVLHERIKQAEREGWCRYLGFVSDEDLPLLFSGARVFAFPSLYEGFGLPVLEAMSSGVPVVCSNSSSLPEVAGQPALMCDPEDVDCFTAHFQTALKDESWRIKAVKQGLLHAATFSWQRCAEDTAGVYRKVMDY